MKIKLDKGAFLPTRAHDADAGYDLRSPVCGVVRAHSSAVIDTGVHMEIPFRFAGFLKSKSGLNVKHDLVSEGVIDSCYTGSIRVKLYNHGSNDYVIEVGDKISQLVILSIVTPSLELVDSLRETERGSNGFGSSGR